jgi:hypothetical protein
MLFKEISGTIVGSETWSQTHVKGTSQGFSYKGIGTSSGRTTSTVTNHTQLWVRSDDGQEVAVRTNPDKFATREGHRVSMLVMPRSSGPSWMVAGINLTTGDRRRESGASLIIMGIMSVIFLGWIPALFFAMHFMVGLATCGLFLWMVGYLITTGAKISSRGSAFFASMSGRATASANLVQTEPAQV